MSQPASGQQFGRGGGPRALARYVDRLTRPVYARRGFAGAAIIERWADIVGPVLAGRTMPDRVVFPRGQRSGGTLHLNVDGGALAVQLQHLEPQIMERINGHFGYRAIDRVRILQRSLPQRKKVAKPPSEAPRPADPEPLSRTVETVTDPELRQALRDLGRAIAARDAADRGNP